MSSRATQFLQTATTKAGKYSAVRTLDIRFAYSSTSDDLVSGAVGKKSYGGVTYSTTSKLLSGVMVDGTTGVNHGKSLFSPAVTPADPDWLQTLLLTVTPIF